MRAEFASQEAEGRPGACICWLILAASGKERPSNCWKGGPGAGGPVPRHWPITLGRLADRAPGPRRPASIATRRPGRCPIIRLHAARVFPNRPTPHQRTDRCSRPRTWKRMAMIARRLPGAVGWPDRATRRSRIGFPKNPPRPAGKRRGGRPEVTSGASVTSQPDCRGFSLTASFRPRYTGRCVLPFRGPLPWANQRCEPQLQPRVWNTDLLIGKMNFCTE